jgi:hypothetical protein
MAADAVLANSPILPSLREVRMRQLSRELHPLRSARGEPGVQDRPLRGGLTAAFSTDLNNSLQRSLALIVSDGIWITAILNRSARKKCFPAETSTGHAVWDTGMEGGRISAGSIRHRPGGALAKPCYRMIVYIYSASHGPNYTKHLLIVKCFFQVLEIRQFYSEVQHLG